MRTVRFRLALWYSLVLAGGLVLFGAALWTSTRHSLQSDVNREVLQQTNGLESFMRSQIGEARVNQLYELREYAEALPSNIFMEVRTVDGRSIMSTDPRLPWSEVRRAGEANRVFVWHGDRYLSATRRISAEEMSWVVSFAGSLRRSEEISARLLWLMLGLIPVVVLVACSGGVWISGRALKPVDEITAAAKVIGIEDLSQRLVVPQTGDELQRLSETWNGMLARLEDAVSRLSRFTADASHELRTPLAVIRSTAEIAGRRTRTEDAYRTALASITKESERMTALIDDLLFLARSDADGLDLPMSAISLTEVLEDVLSQLLPLAQARGIQLSWQDGEGQMIWGNRVAIRRLILILVDNAIKYCRPAGQVRIWTEAMEGQIRLRVQDQGFGIPPAEMPFVFQRFYRGHSARDDGNNGFGLGLALASGIAQRHRSSVQVTSTSEDGSVFDVALPTSPQH